MTATNVNLSHAGQATDSEAPEIYRQVDFAKGKVLPPKFASVEEERLDRKRRLAVSLRLFSTLGHDDAALAGNATVRDPGDPELLWTNPYGRDLSRIRVSDLICLNEKGDVVHAKGKVYVNDAGFVLHSRVHAARPDVMATVHNHSVNGVAWSCMNRLLDPISQDSLAFYEDHALFDYGGPAIDEVQGMKLDEGDQVAKALGRRKAIILKNHGLFTVGETMDEAAFWFILMDRSCKVQLMCEAAGTPTLIPHELAQKIAKPFGSPLSGWFHFKPFYERIVDAHPDVLE